jgi:nucleoside-diphosphate-sugar epimerase
MFPKWPETTSDRIPYFPLDGAIPPRPDNPYGLSKEIGERALRYFADNHGIVGFAIRYPQLLGNHTRARPKGKVDANLRNNPWTAFSWLDNRDAAALIDTLLRCDLTGFHIFTPTSRLYGVEPHSIAELSEKHFPGVPWKTPLEQATSFFDVAEITAATGWKPAIDDPLAE